MKWLTDLRAGWLYYRRHECVSFWDIFNVR